jgi:hypothetical protein
VLKAGGASLTHCPATYLKLGLVFHSLKLAHWRRPVRFPARRLGCPFTEIPLAKPINEPISRLPSCAQCGKPAALPYATRFLGMWFDAAVCKERWRAELRDKERSRPDSGWMQQLKRKAR